MSDYNEVLLKKKTTGKVTTALPRRSRKKSQTSLRKREVDRRASSEGLVKQAVLHWETSVPRTSQSRLHSPEITPSDSLRRKKPISQGSYDFETSTRSRKIAMDELPEENESDDDQTSVKPSFLEDPSFLNLDCPERSYLQPTVSSKLKCSAKVALASYSMIPFVAAASTNKSHNLGIKIQETLSLIKKIYPSNSFSIDDVRTENDLQSTLNNKRYYQKALEQMLDDEGGSFLSALLRWKNRAFLSPSDLKLCATPNGDVRKALKYLHDEFNEINGKFETLKRKTDNGRGDYEQHDLRDLRHTLDMKELVINVILGLFKEVNRLKKSAHFYRDGSSLNTSRGSTSCFSIFSKRNSSSSTKLTRLMRRIQQFQDRLKESFSVS